ncbi:MAG TPA: hypothetical protein VKU02_15490 [Gemmataceae bacterium]|nr:hypothetical protein [Gemmataceae bacterium]
MLRTSLCSVVALALLAVGLARADDTKNKTDKSGQHHVQATITRIDRQKNTITVKMMDKNGREEEKTLHLADGATYFDNNGKAATLAAFHTGDDVLITEKGDKITEVRKHAEATITKVDPRAGTVTVRMKDQNGKEVDRTFHLTEDAEYLDSSGRVATLDVFRSGDQVLVVESEGRIKAMKKAGHKTPSGQIRGERKSGGQ